MKKIFAYIFGIVGWLIGLIIGIIITLLYGKFQDPDYIDITYFLTELIIPAIISVFASNFLFQYFIDDKDISYKIHKTIINIILIIIFSFILYNSLLNKKYSNIVYVLTGYICSIYFILSKKNEEDNNIYKNVEPENPDVETWQLVKEKMNEKNNLESMEENAPEKDREL